MKMTNQTNDFFNFLQHQIEAAEKNKQPIAKYVKKQIDVLKESHDAFIKQAKKEGFNLQNPQVGEIEIQQYNSMKALAKKIGLPVEEYDKLIKEVQVRILGEENAKKYLIKWSASEAQVNREEYT